MVAAAGSRPEVWGQTATDESDPKLEVQRVCVGCHNDRSRLGNLSLEHFDVTAADKNPDVAEKMIRKLRAGMMPPPRAQRPPDETLTALAKKLEQVVDEAAIRDPNPGGRTFQRLNRPEYERAVHDLVALDVHAKNWLPPDQMSANFDNMADTQTLSPTLLDAYLNAASAISRMAIGDRNAPSIDETYTNSQYISQHPWDRVEGAPYGTRGGMAMVQIFCSFRLNSISEWRTLASAGADVILMAIILSHAFGRIYGCL